VTLHHNAGVVSRRRDGLVTKPGSSDETDNDYRAKCHGKKPSFRTWLSRVSKLSDPAAGLHFTAATMCSNGAPPSALSGDLG
jgi:hypothetical protein